MSSFRSARAARSSSHRLNRAVLETLEERRLFAIARPDHVVVIVEEDRFDNAIGDTARMPFTNQLAAGGLLYNNSHAPLHPSRPDYFMLFSGATQGVTDNFSVPPLFTTPNLAQSINNNPGTSFISYAESMPADGSLVDQAKDLAVDPQGHPDVYIRPYNPAAWWSNLGTGKALADVNKTFNAFPTDFTQLPTVSFVIPDMFHNTHGSNEAPYTAASSDYVQLRINADAWLKAKFEAYANWAKANNSLLIITTDEDDVGHTPANGITTMVIGDPRLVQPGTNNTNVGHYNLLRTIMDMYTLAPLGGAATAAAFPTNATGQLVPTGAVTLKTSSTALAANTNPSVFGQNVTFTATVTSSQGGTPSGSVTFKDGSTTLGTGTLNGSGVATFSTTALSVASHSITAVYSGDAAYSTSTSSGLTDVVNKANTTTTLSALTSKVFGQSVTFTATVAPVAPGGGTPTGTVQFVVDGLNFGSAVTLSGGSATSAATTTLSIGSHTVAAVYAATTSYNGSTSSNASQQVNQASTTTSVSSSANPALSGQSVTFSATVAAAAPGGGIPAGTIQFVIDSVNYGAPVTLNASGVATSDATSTLTDGPHIVSAVYSGNTNYTGSTSSNFTQNITAPLSTSTTLGASANPSVFGQSVTLTATVSASQTPNAGTVTFKDGATTLGTGTVNASGIATLALSNLAVGPHSIVASYGGTGLFIASDSNSLSQTVNPANTSTAVTSSANPSNSGQSVTFTATVSATAPGAGTRTGTVQFVIDSVNFGAPVAINASGVATSSAITTLAGGGHSVVAVYSGDGNFNGSTSSTLTQTVTVGPPANDAFASRISLGTVASVTTTGTNAGATKQNNEPNHAGVVGGKSVWWTWTAPAAGATVIDTTGSNFDTLLAVYTGSSIGGLTAVASNNNDGANITSRVTFTAVKNKVYQIAVDGAAGATGNIVLRINPPAAPINTSTALASSTNPAVFGQSVSLTATVTAGTGTPTGSVTFTDGATTLGTIALNGSGQAVFTTSSLAIGGHSIIASYAGATGYLASGSSALSQTVNQANTTTALASSINPAALGQAVSFTATVSTSAPGAGTPAGTVQFQIDGSDFGSPVTLVNGVATSASTNSLTGGGHTVTATYSGSSTHNGSASSQLTQNVLSPVTTTTTVGSSANPSVFGQGITLTATVTGSTTPNAGTVTFSDGATTLGTGTVNASGVATLVLSSLSVGGHSITASYGGSGLFLASDSTATPLAQTVSQANSSTAVTSSTNPSAVGQSVTFTATVSASAPGAGTRTGTVQFVIDNVNFGAPVAINASGVATSGATTALTGGGHSVVAIYSGDGNFIGSTSSTLTQTVTVGPPANDAFASRVVLGAVASANVNASNAGATKQTGEPNHAGNAGGTSIWYSWTAPGAGTVVIDTAGSSFDTLLACYTGTAVNGLTAVASNDNDGLLTTSKITFTSVANRTYQIAIDGFGGASGSVALNIALAAVPAAPEGVHVSSGDYSDRIDVTWQASAGATSYDVYRWTNNTVANAIKVGTDVTGLIFRDTTALGETIYYYWVVAKNTYGSSPFSVPDNGYRTAGAPPAPPVPQNLMASLFGSTAIAGSSAKDEILQGVSVV